MFIWDWTYKTFIWYEIINICMSLKIWYMRKIMFIWDLTYKTIVIIIWYEMVIVDMRLEIWDHCKSDIIWMRVIKGSVSSWCWLLLAANSWKTTFKDSELPWLIPATVTTSQLEHFLAKTSQLRITTVLFRLRCHFHYFTNVIYILMLTMKDFMYVNSEKEKSNVLCL